MPQLRSPVANVRYAKPINLIAEIMDLMTKEKWQTIYPAALLSRCKGFYVCRPSAL
jgi:hypothetical protein